MDAYGRITNKAQALVDAGEVSNMAKAISVVAERNPSLYDEYINEKRGA